MFEEKINSPSVREYFDSWLKFLPFPAGLFGAVEGLWAMNFYPGFHVIIHCLLHLIVHSWGSIPVYALFFLCWEAWLMLGVGPE